MQRCWQAWNDFAPPIAANYAITGILLRANVMSDKFASIVGACLQARLGVICRESPESPVNTLLQTEFRSQHYTRELSYTTLV